MLNLALSAVSLLLLLTAAAAQVSVRLADGPNPKAERLEVYYNGTWGTVCHDYFDTADAKVVCYMLGHGHSGLSRGTRYGHGSGKIWLDDVQCRGTENNIADCRHYGWGIHNCRHIKDVSVECIPVRLVEGPSPLEGRLEVHYDGVWGTVCDDGFDEVDASVVCEMLGYGRSGRLINQRYGASNGTIWLDDVQCTGTETSIVDCRHHGWGRLRSCYHWEDVSVSCSTVSLVRGSSPQEGLLEVHRFDTWGTVCDDYFDDAAARVVCHMLGYGYFGHFLSNRYGAGSGPIWLDDVHCYGNETNISDCRHRGWGHHDCNHEEDVSVSCITVRLVGGSSPEEGRLEVRYKGTWGTVCDDYFDNAAAGVVCYMLGFKHAGRFIGNRYGPGNGTIWLDSIRCHGMERHISECSNGIWGTHNCGHHEDVAVSCTS